MWRETREKVELEIGLLHRLVDSHESLMAKVADTEPDSVELSALSAYIHSYYTGIENIFKRIAMDVDGQRPSADRWHSDLLNLMSAPSANRPALIPPTLRAKLADYLAFRHVFRNAYTFDLRWDKMHSLVRDSVAVLQELDDACRALFEGG